MKSTHVALLLALVSSSAGAQRVYVPHGFETGNDYQQMLPLQRQHYDAGVLDGYMAAPMLAVQNIPLVLALQRCDQRMGLTDAQLRAIVDKYLEDNPERWGDDMGELVLNALMDACRRVGAPLN